MSASLQYVGFMDELPLGAQVRASLMREPPLFMRAVASDSNPDQTPSAPLSWWQRFVAACKRWLNK